MRKAVNLSTRPQLTVRVTATGARGKSAYEAALLAGFSGTEGEFSAGLAQAAGGATMLAFPTREEFPPEGRETALYLDQGANKLYRYSATEQLYHPLIQDFPRITLLSGGRAVLTE